VTYGAALIAGRPTDRRRVDSVNSVTQPQVPSPYSQQGSDEQLWRRPADANPISGAPSPIGGAPSKPNAPYPGPPPTIPVRPDWRPRTLIQVPPARKLPTQDDAALDEDERSARTVSYGVGMVAGAIALIVLFVLCGRVLF
jgi:hypothetical protein